MKKHPLKKRFQKLAGIKSTLNEQNIGITSGCPDPVALNYDPSWENNFSDMFGAFVCQYNYGCASFTSEWAPQLWELAQINAEYSGTPFPHVVPSVNGSPNSTPYVGSGILWQDFDPSPAGMADYICQWVCPTAIDINGGQYCPACYAGEAGFSFSGNLSNQNEGLSICTCCDNITNGVEGCTDPNALNYDEQAVIDDGSCEYPPTGCTDPEALNYDSSLSEEQSCGWPNMINYCCDYPPEETEPCETFNNLVSFTQQANACMMYFDPTNNISPNIGQEMFDEIFQSFSILTEQGSCCTIGCTDENALNYDENAHYGEDDICEHIDGCMDENASNYNPEATIQSSWFLCDYIYGCTDDNALNYDPEANLNDGSCEYPPNPGCMDQTALNYDPDANDIGIQGPYTDEVGCTYLGCMDPEALNYDPVATFGPGGNAFQYGSDDSVGFNVGPGTGMENIQDWTGALIQILPCLYTPEGCTDPEAWVNPYTEPNQYGNIPYLSFGGYDAINEIDDGSCIYPITCYRCEYPSGPQMYGTPGELVSEEFFINPGGTNPNFDSWVNQISDPNSNYPLGGCPTEGVLAYYVNEGGNPSGPSPVDYNWSEEELDCSGTHTIDDTLKMEEITCYQCDIPTVPTYGMDYDVISQVFEVPEGQGCPEDEGWYNEEPDCSGDPFDVVGDTTRYRCKHKQSDLYGNTMGQCVPSANGPYATLQECEDAGCGEKKKKKKCFKCKGNAPVGYMFDDPPGCPKGWQDTWEDLKCDNCEDPLVDEWLNHPQIIGTHCCELHLQLSGYEGGAPGPQCYNTWEQLGGDPNFNPHECCSGDSGQPKRYKCRFTTSLGICEEDPNGNFDTLEQCVNSGCEEGIYPTDGIDPVTGLPIGHGGSSNLPTIDSDDSVIKRLRELAGIKTKK